jgi:NAD(P)H-hydrate epimerase
MAGAAALAGIAALRSGAGLVRVATPAEVQPTVAGFEPALMTWPLVAGNDGTLLCEENQEALAAQLDWADVIALGPGLGRSSVLDRLVAWILLHATVPVILDADGLNAMIGRIDLLAPRHAPTILTPHPGELARLIGTAVPEVQADRVETAAEVVRFGKGLIVVLKGTGTIVTDGRRYFVNETGNPGMATAGTGDVLTGIISGLVAQGLPAFEAAVLGVAAHGRAGDLAALRRSEIGLIASDLLDTLSEVWKT